MSWQENFGKRVVVVCANEFCENTTITLVGTAAAVDVLCEGCRVEAKRLADNRYYELRGRRRRRERRRQQRGQDKAA